MKIAIPILILLGIVAAISAAAIFLFLRTDTNSEQATLVEKEIVRVVKALPALTVLQAEYLKAEKAPAKTLPAGYVSSAEVALGKILAVPMVEGQVVTTSCFIREGLPAQFAAALPEGMRAFTISVSRKSVSGGLLYAGCVVDVLASFRLSRSEKGEALSTTLLREVPVLAVNSESIVSEQDSDNPEEEGQKARPRQKSSSSDVLLTLMVDPKQSEALQLAVAYGTISVTMRNPLDKGAVGTDPTLLSQGQLATLGSAMDPTTLLAKYGEGKIPNPLDANESDLLVQDTANEPGANAQHLLSGMIGEGIRKLVTGLNRTVIEEPNKPVTVAAETATATATEPEIVTATETKQPSSWSVMVIRGQNVQTEDLTLPKNK